MNVAKTMILLAAMTALFLATGWIAGGGTGLLIALVFALATNAYAYWNSDTLALRANGAEPVTAASAPELHRLVATLAKSADLPMPTVYLIRSEQPNAFAIGRDPDNAAVAATTGLLKRLNREEVAGVMAHELAHIKNRDTLIMTVAATVAGAISAFATMLQFGMMFGGNRSERSPIGVIGILLAVILAPLAAMLIQMTISRTREYAADRLGAEIAGDPMGLANALRKIAGGGTAVEIPAVERNPAMAHLFIVNPLSGARMDNLFSTHPNAANRIAALEAMAGPGQSGPKPAAVRRSTTIPFVPRNR
ncbi:MAG: zinc metalloprotease HtpX [Pseudomonadota bacterium]